MLDVNKQFTIIREFDAPQELVFKAWTNPKMIAQWWGPKGVFTPICEVDAKPGGDINIVMEAGVALGEFKGTQWPMEGSFVEIEEPSKIVFTANAISDGEPILEHKTTVTFEEKNEKTKMTVHIHIKKVNEALAKPAVGGMEQGWNEQFDKMVEFVNKYNTNGGENK